MVCIFAPGSSKTLCGGKVTDFVGFFEGRADCAACLIRQDAMFERGYKQTTYHVCYIKTMYKARVAGSVWSSIHIKGGTYLQFTCWDAKTLRGAIKLGKLGVLGMG